jgi:hypothetical protein
MVNIKDLSVEEGRKKFREANRLFLKGNSITDKQLEILIKGYEHAADALDLFGPNDIYYLAWKELHYRLEQLRGFQQARKEKNH